jgi:hypothetical protein
MEPELQRLVDRALAQVARGVGLLAAVTPLNAAEERYRLERAFEAGNPSSPAWRYAAGTANGTRTELRRVLERTRSLIDDRQAPGDLYRERADELALELDVIARVGRPDFGEIATKRFPAASSDIDRLAADLAALANAAPGTPAEECPSDGGEPESLLSRVRALLGEQRLGFRIEVRRELAPAAATGDGVILIAAGRHLTHEAAARTAMHEVFGHALPRARAAAQPLGLFGIGTARGADEQEGYALLLEERAGYMHHTRAGELAARHDAVRMMRGGADFVGCVHHLRKEHGQSAAAAVRIAERVFRGSDGRRPGLGREAVYLAAFAAVRAHLADHPEDEIVIASGQIAVAAAKALRAHHAPPPSFAVRPEFARMSARG